MPTGCPSLISGTPYQERTPGAACLRRLGGDRRGDRDVRQVARLAGQRDRPRHALADRETSGKRLLGRCRAAGAEPELAVLDERDRAAGEVDALAQRVQRSVQDALRGRSAPTRPSLPRRAAGSGSPAAAAPAAGASPRGAGIASRVAPQSEERGHSSRAPAGRTSGSPARSRNRGRAAAAAARSVSTPSAVTRRSKVCAMATTPPTMAALPASTPRPETKERSTFTWSTGNRAR